MLFRMRFRTLFTLLLSLIAPAGSASANMRFNDEQGITTELVHNIVPPGKATSQLVQDSGKVRHPHRHLLLHQSVCNAPGKETPCRCLHHPREEAQGSLRAWSAIALHKAIQMERIKELQDFIGQQSNELTEFDEKLVKRWLRQITVWDDYYIVELKLGLSIDVPA